MIRSLDNIKNKDTIQEVPYLEKWDIRGLKMGKGIMSWVSKIFYSHEGPKITDSILRVVKRDERSEYQSELIK